MSKITAREWVEANDRIVQTLANRSAEATARYHEGYDNAAYMAATKGKSTRYANNLIDAAMALCGDPGYDWPAERRWCNEAWVFLARFAQEPRTYVCAGCDVEWNRRPSYFVTFAEGRKQVLGLCRTCALKAGPDGELVAELMTYAREFAALRARVRMRELSPSIAGAKAHGQELAGWIDREREAGGYVEALERECVDYPVGTPGRDAFAGVGPAAFGHPGSARAAEEFAEEMAEGEKARADAFAEEATRDPGLAWIHAKKQEIAGEDIQVVADAMEGSGWLFGVRRGIARTEIERAAWAKNGWAAVQRADREDVDPCEGCEDSRCYTQRSDELDCPFSMDSEAAMARAGAGVAGWIKKFGAARA